MSLFISPQIRRLIDMALDEDQVGFDISSQIFFGGADAPSSVEAYLLAKEGLVLSGVAVFAEVFRRVDPTIACHFERGDGEAVSAGERFASIRGPIVGLLGGERIALNFLQRMSGIATRTARFVEALEGASFRVADTRKTLPGYRELDKYAVRCGGGANHRYSLGGGVMIKDNHIAAAGSIGAAVERARARAPHTLGIEVETTDLEEVEEALEAGADVIMLDNMDADAMREAIEVIRGRAGDAVVIEASGNITLSRLPELRDLDLDFASVGALTHSVQAADISMRFAS
jgi:nicotinate-nucleotide pyrophosphorylase (carboxylating)